MRLDFSTIVPCMPYSGWNVFRSMTPSATYSGDWHGRGASAVRSLGRVADGAPATAQRGLHPGLGFHRVRALREQEGALQGHNPRKHGRPSHHPLLAALAEAHFLLHGWLRSGNCGSARGVVEFLQEALALWGQRQMIRLVRADSGFFEDKLLSFLEQRSLPYIVVARLTKFIKREAQRVASWRALDENFSVGEFRLKLLGWERERRFVVVRERERERRQSPGRKLFEVPGYTFRLLVTS